MEFSWVCLCLAVTAVSVVAGTHTKCLPSPCANWGTCYYDRTLGDVACLCPHGYKGRFCAEVDLCAGSPCENGGTCVPDPASLSHKCVCDVGFTGPNCRTVLSACSSNPCQHGQCIDLVSSYMCQCAPGYTGTQCEIDVGVCGSDPCNRLDSWATCSEADAGYYTCQCSSDEYYGLNCEDTAGQCSQQEESYCICSVNHRAVKFPIPSPSHSGGGVNTRDIIAALIGLLLAWAIGSAFLILMHLCCSGGGAGGGAYKQRSKKPWDRPNSASTTDTMVTTSARTPRQVHPAVTPTLNKNVYRAGFMDDMSHMVASRKSPNTYTSGAKDW